MKETTDKTFDQDVTSNETVVLDFWASWCGPCKTLSPILDRIDTSLVDSDKVSMFKVNVDDNPGLSERFNITAVPTVLVFQEGALRDTLVGLQTEKTYRKTIGIDRV
jgi:thioredoxin 1